MHLDSLGRVDQSTLVLRTVGQLLMYWGQVETSLSWSLVTVAPHMTGPHIEVNEIARTLDRLLGDFRKAHAWASGGDVGHMSAVDDLRRRISERSVTRNTICHGFTDIWLDSGPEDVALCCWSQYHQMRAKGQFPGQRFIKYHELKQEVDNVYAFRGEIRDLTQAL